ncbi:Eukaryotic translation initiation factor 3 subunit G [Halotydeus destructor]|nr:Eukaryotic translation initiation factor 3 subunit G [Halotydeus destructor]
MAPVEGAKASKKDLPTSWADQMEEGDDAFLALGTLPSPVTTHKGDTKIVTSYEIDEETGKKLRKVRYYKIEKVKVSKAAAIRKGWKKYGKASDDGQGPNPSNTVIQDEILMDFPHMAQQGQEDSAMNAKKMGKGFVKCRFCEMDHWSTACPYKDKLAVKQTDAEAAASAAGGMGGSTTLDKDGKVRYVPPSMRDGASRKGDMMSTRSKDEANTVRVTNLPEDIQDQDIRELFNEFGRISRIFLARDKHTGQSKGFAFVSFEAREAAARAVAMVHGHGYANLILNVEWAKPSGN